MSSLSSSLSLPRSGAGTGSPVDVFAAGHLGELTRYLPVELVDDVLELTGATQRRLRTLPSRVGVYFLLALAMFPRLGYLQVWDKLTAGLVGAPRPSEKALRDLRRRLGPAPMRALFAVLAGPVAQPRTPGVSYRGLRTVAFDGLNSLDVPDTRANRAWLGRCRNQHGLAGYPNLRVLALVETGTRGLIGATRGSHAQQSEPALAEHLLGLVKPGMLVLADRAYDCDRFPAQVAATGAQVLIRCKSTRALPAYEHLPDGSYRSRVGEHTIRVIDADLTATTRDGQRIGDRYRLITTLTDPHRYPAGELIKLYHQRWEIETAFLALRHTLLHGLVLRSTDRFGLEQELWALLTLYQLLRMAMVTAIETRPDTDPDRACFTTALETARNQVTAAAGLHPQDPVDLPGTIGRAILRTLLPPRRTRTSIRKTKRTSRYATREAIRNDPRPRTSTPITSITTTIHTPPLATPTPPRPRPRPSQPPTRPQPNTRRARVTQIMNTHPHRSWNGNHLAQQLNTPPHNLLTQLAEWARHGLLTKTGHGTYTLNTTT